MNRTPYFIVSPQERRGLLKIGCLCAVTAALAMGIFAGACCWARSQVRGCTVEIRETVPPVAE